MTNKKLTDSEIVKALGICGKSTNGCSHSKYTCEDCYLNGQPMCSSVLIQDAINYFNRLQAENEELKTENQILSQKRFNIFERIEYSDKLKAEAYKEFAERLESKKLSTEDIQHRVWNEYVEVGYIKNLLKELVGEDNLDQFDK